MEEQEGKKTYKENDIIDEETSEGENPDYVVPTVNDAEGILLTIPVGIQEGVTKNIKNNNDRIDEGKDGGESTEYDSTTVNNEEACGNVDRRISMTFMATWTNILHKIQPFGRILRKPFGKVQSLKYHTVRNQRIQSI